MELNKKCKEMIIDFRKNKTTIPPTEIRDQPIARVKSYKLLRVWLDDDMKWSTNTEYITKKAAKRLHLLKILKNYDACKNDQVWHETWPKDNVTIWKESKNERLGLSTLNISTMKP